MHTFFISVLSLKEFSPPVQIRIAIFATPKQHKTNGNVIVSANVSLVNTSSKIGKFDDSSLNLTIRAPESNSSSKYESKKPLAKSLIGHKKSANKWLTMQMLSNEKTKSISLSIFNAYFWLLLITVDWMENLIWCYNRPI